MPLPLEAFLPLSSGISVAVVAATFFILWRLQSQFHLASFGISFLCVATVQMMRGIDTGIVHLPWRGIVADAVFIAGVVFLLAGCLVLARRAVPWPLLLCASMALYATTQIVALTLHIPGVVYVPSLTALAYLLITYLFLTRRVDIGNTTLGLLFALRGLVNIPWLVVKDPVHFLIHAADLILILATGLALIVTELVRARQLVEAGNARLRRQADDLYALNARLKEEHAHAVSANLAKSEFLANMSHELRTPLNAVIGFSDVIAEQRFGAMAERYAEYGRDIRSAGQHLLGIIDNLLEMSRIEAGKTEVKLRPVSIKDVTRSALTMTQHKAVARDIDVAVHIDDAADRIVADEQLLKQILINLLSNAIKYNKPGGSVRLRVTAGSPIADASQMNGQKIGDSVEISVEDTGIGINSDDLHTIFEPFAFAGSSATRSHGGIGLGLSITKRLVELHRGEVTIDSEEDRGTNVRVWLPVGGVG